MNSEPSIAERLTAEPAAEAPAVPRYLTTTMTRRGRPPRARKERKPEAQKPPRSRTVCTGRPGCTAGHHGAYRERPCVVCGVATFQLQPVAAWDVPACAEHDLARDFRVRVLLGFGQAPRFEASKRVAIP